MRHLLRVAIAAGIVVTTLLPQPAFANSITRAASPPLIGTFSGLCSFPITTTPVPVTRTQTETDFYDNNNKLIAMKFTGVFYLSLQNADTGKSVVVNASGAGTNYVQPDGSLIGHGAGPAVIGLFATDEGGPALLYILGGETFDISPTGRISNLSVHGIVTDM